MKYDNLITNILIAVLVVLVGISVYLQISERIDVDIKIRKAVENIHVENGKKGKDGITPIKNIDYFDGKTPSKGVDYFDGKDGKNGKDSVSTHTIEKKIETVIKEVPVKGDDGLNGLTPIIRCNAKKNRWEVKYNQSEFTVWEIMNNEIVPCKGIE
jgi:hypothetical protein